MTTYTIDNLNASVVFQDNIDKSKKITFDLSSLSTATTRTISFPNTNITLVDIDLA